MRASYWMVDIMVWCRRRRGVKNENEKTASIATRVFEARDGLWEHVYTALLGLYHGIVRMALMSKPE